MGPRLQTKTLKIKLTKNKHFGATAGIVANLVTQQKMSK